MNRNALDKTINFYKSNYTKIEKEELYKWKATKHFKDNFDFDADDFYSMLKEALRKTYNLMDSGYYYPHRMILWMAEKEPNAVKNMFMVLFDLTKDLNERIEFFQSEAQHLIKNHIEEKTDNHYQDIRAIMVYLSSMYPDKYYLYKYKMFKNFVERVDYDVPPKIGDPSNLYKFMSLCEYIRNYILQDEELLTMYEQRRTQYYDPEYHLLVQDIIYAPYYEVEPDLLEPVKIVNEINLPGIVSKNKIILKGSKIDYVEVEKHNTLVGSLGEQFIYNQEVAKVKKFKLSKKKEVKWISRDQGDGLGYDILSYDNNGEPKYIEVKTTTGVLDKELYITANELLCSQQKNNQYWLYRVYDFDVKSVEGKIAVRKGSLEELCVMPVSYKVVFHDEIKGVG